MNVGYLGEPDNGIGEPIDRGDAATIDRDFLLEGAACPLNDGAFDLIAQAVGLTTRPQSCGT